MGRRRRKEAFIEGKKGERGGSHDEAMSHPEACRGHLKVWCRDRAPRGAGNADAKTTTPVVDL